MEYVPFLTLRDYLPALQRTEDSVPAEVEDISWSDIASQPTGKAKKRGWKSGVRHTVREWRGEEHSEEKREQASTSCHYIFHFQTAVEQNSQLLWNTTGIIARAV